MKPTTSTPIRGRFAPSPTGRMHLGNVYTALLSWLSVKAQDGAWILRIEDLDPQRSKPAYAAQIEDDLRWLGLPWDEGGDTPGYRQSERTELYTHYFRLLEQQRLVYPCFCRRADILAAQAPHATDHHGVYAGTCRHLTAAEIAQKTAQRTPSYRLKVPNQSINFADGHYGTQSHNLQQICGDFVVRRADGGFAYQLAVVVDDALMHINQVVRGNDLLASTPQQIYLYRLLGFDVPQFYHLPLLCSASGDRLCKRDKSLDLGELRKHYTAEEIVGKLAFLAHLIDKEEPIAPRELLPLFDWQKIPHHNIIV
ncbi:MAG: tRNA glutamyl-Q(34) synthetase GluQRS [Paludibacteraceae bacterium]